MYVFKVLSEEGGNPIGRNIALPWESNTTSQLLSFLSPILIMRGFPGGAVVKNLPANAGDPRKMSSIPGLGRSARVGNDNPHQWSCLENPMDRGDWWPTVHGSFKRVGHD